MKELLNIILSVDDEPAYFPNQIPGRLCYNKPFPYSRMGEVFNIITSEGKKNKYFVSKLNKEFIKNIPTWKFYSLTGSLSDMFYYIREPATGKERIFATQSVDTDRPWTIDIENNVEIFRYLKPDENYRIIDGAINYAERMD